MKVVTRLSRREDRVSAPYQGSRHEVPEMLDDLGLIRQLQLAQDPPRTGPLLQLVAAVLSECNANPTPHSGVTPHNGRLQ